MNERFDRDAHYRGVLAGAMARGAAPPAPAVAEGAPWYAVQAVPRGEWVAMRELAGLGMEAFLPHFRDKRGMRGRFIIVGVPAFPGYLFARIGESAFGAVRRADGVLDVVRVGDQFAALPEAVMETLIGACDGFGCMGWVHAPAAPEVVWAVGELVRMTGGPFAGFPGVVSAVDKAGRIGVDIGIFGRPTPVTVSSGEVERISPPRKKRPRQGRRERAPTVTNRTAPGEQGQEPC